MSNSNETDALEERITVFDDPINFSVKHPLNAKWTLWFDNPTKRPNANQWEIHLKSMIDFETIEDFWGIYNHAVPPSNLPLQANYYLFRNGIKPAWEDPKNENGGKWTVTINKSRKDELLDSSWLNTVLNCIGETADFSEEICGAVCSIRKGNDRIHLWLTGADQEKCEAIGRHFKIACGLTNEIIKYELHPKH
ncbi:hypothetical protein HDU92_004811 [Lobulomyces angularis]|nr:hypothetical protein HDU92_004811 [Lobulomyces angularis]